MEHGKSTSSSTEPEVKPSLSDKRVRSLIPPLPYLEILFYWSLWISCLVSAMYSFIRETEDTKDELYVQDFSDGWKIFGRRKDISDFEWQFWTGMIRFFLPALVLHGILGNIVSRTFPTIKPYFCLAFSLIFLTAAVGYLPVLFMISHCVVTYISAMTRSVVSVWCSSLLILLSLQHDDVRFWQMRKMTDNHNTSDFILFVSLMSNLRCISFGLEYCWQHSDHKPETSSRKKLGTSFVDLMVFNFYLPVFGNGPVITYSAFYEKFHSYTGQFTKEEFRLLAWDAVRTLLWYIALEVSFHFVYSSAVSREPQVYMYLSAWALSGFVYWNLHIFLVKYVVFYCCTALMTRPDGLDPPKPPRCVSTLYLFTDMWRYFDRGLYEWMKRYIYVPLGGSHLGVIRQILGSFCPFFFIWYWHGGNTSLLWWLFANWLGVTAEGLAGRVLQIPAAQQLECQLSPAMSRRVRAMCGVLTVIPLILSNMVFLIGTTPVAFYIKKIFYSGFPVAPLILYGAMYTSVQTNMELNRYKKDQQVTVESDLAWFETLSPDARIGFIVGMVVLGLAVLLCGCGVLCGFLCTEVCNKKDWNNNNAQPRLVVVSTAVGTTVKQTEIQAPRQSDLVLDSEARRYVVTPSAPLPSPSRRYNSFFG